MKRIRLVLAAMMVVLLSAGSVSAGLRYGVKVGLNVNNLHFDKEKLFDSENRAGFTAGFMVEYNVPLVGVGVDLGVMYTRMNSEPEVKVGSFTASNSKFGKNFIEIPLNLKYRLTLPAISAIFKPGIYTGPTLALCCDCADDNNFIKARTCQWGWSVGLTFEFIRHLQLSGGYTFGINNIMDLTPAGEKLGLQSADLKAKNNYWTVTVGWLF